MRRHPKQEQTTDSPEAEDPPLRSPPRNWALAALLAALLAIFYLLHDALLPFIAAAALAFVLNPVIDWLCDRFHVGRVIPAILLYLAFLLLLACFGYWLWTVVSSEYNALAKDGPRMIQDLLRQLLGPNGVSLFGKTYTAHSLYGLLEQRLGGLIDTGAAGVAAKLGIGAIIGGFLTLVLIPYFLVSGPRIAHGLLWLVPPERRPSVRRMLPKLIPVLRRYMVGITVVVIFTAIAAWLGFGLVFGLPHAVALSIAVGVLEIIPALGPATSMALVALSSTQEHSAAGFALLMGYAVLLRLVIDNGIGPVVLGRASQLHPVAVMFAFVCGAALIGVVGLLLAVPAAACIVVVLDNYYRERVAEPERDR